MDADANNVSLTVQNAYLNDRCGLGRQLVGGTCEDVDECLWQPCLNSGSCYNLRPGFLCVCGPGHSGEHCQWTDTAAAGHHLAATLVLAFLTLSLLLLGKYVMTLFLTTTKKINKIPCEKVKSVTTTKKKLIE